MQRKIERAIRKQKNRILVDEAADDKDKLLSDQIRLQRYRQEYVRFSKAAGLRTQNERAQVAGFGRKQAAEAITATKVFTEDTGYGTIKAITGARIINPEGKAANMHAERYYGLVRSMKTDVTRIASNTGISEIDIAQIKKYLFIDEHDLGEGRYSRFDPDFAIAQSRQRLINGNPERHDITLLRHEMEEFNLVKMGATQHQAHILASEMYNYSKEAREYYAAIKKHKDK